MDCASGKPPPFRAYTAERRKSELDGVVLKEGRREIMTMVMGTQTSGARVNGRLGESVCWTAAKGAGLFRISRVVL